MNTTHHYSVIEQALNFIAERHPQQPKLSIIANHCQLSEPHLERIFTDFAGVSPTLFLQQLTRSALKARLLNDQNSLRTSKKVGLLSLNQHSNLNIRLRAISTRQLKSAGAGLQFWFGVHRSLFGRCLIVTATQGIHQLAFIDSDEQLKEVLSHLKTQWPLASIIQDNHATEQLTSLLFEHQQEQAVTLWVQGSAFQIKVWEALLTIPAGKVSSYSAVAQWIGQPQAARAVGSAIAKNPVAVLIPCHRVIQQQGTTGAYRWGATRKQVMLSQEACQQQGGQQNGRLISKTPAKR